MRFDELIQSNLVRTTILFAVLFPLISYAMTGEGMSFGRWIVTVAIFGSLMAAVEYVERRFLR